MIITFHALCVIMMEQCMQLMKKNNNNNHINHKVVK